MTDALGQWFEAQAARERRAVLLEDALLGNRFAAYFRYRLRFFFARYAVATVMQLLKILLLHRLLGEAGFISLVVVVAGASLVAAGWWGALEVLRARVRRLYRFESSMAVSREIARWVSTSLRAAIAIATAVVVAGVVGMAAGGSLPGPVELAVGAVLLRVGFDLPIRAYHAGAFAVRRVYRPWPSIIVLETLGLASIALLSPFLGAYAVAAGELVMAVAFAFVSLRYARRAHRLLGFHAGREVRVLPRPTPRRHGRGRRWHGLAVWNRTARSVREVAAPATAGLLMGLDAIVVLAVVGAAAVRPGKSWLAILFAAIVPTVHAGFDWPQLVYFDLKRLDAPLFDNLRRRLDRGALRLALGLAAAFSVVGLAVALGPLGLREPWLAALPVFLLGSSLLGLFEMQAFADGAYRRVILGGAVLLAGLLGLGPVGLASFEPLGALALATLIAAGAVRVSARLGVARGAEADPLLPAAWVSSLAASRGPVRIGAVRVRGGDEGRWTRDLAEPAAARDWRAQQLARRLAGGVAMGGAVTVVGGECVAWFEPADRRTRIDSRRAVLEASGRVADVRGATEPDGHAALGLIGRWGVFRQPAGPPVSHTAGIGDCNPGHAVPDVPHPADLESAFLRLVTGGIVYSPERPAPPELESLGAADRRLILWEAIRHARTLSTRPGRGAFDVTAWCPAGSVELVFIAPRALGSRRLVRWRRIVRSATLATASGGALATADMLGESARGARPAALAASVATSLRPG